MTTNDLNDILTYEKNIYINSICYSNGVLKSRIKMEAPYRIWKWQRFSRLSDYYRCRMYEKRGILKFYYGVMYLFYLRKKNVIGEKLGLEIGTENIGKGLVVYHYNNVVNSNVIIGENCHIHGTVVIGNNGITDDAPTIGNNVMIGAGVKIIGPVVIADNIKIAAGAVVVHSFTESGITIAGVPARKVSK